MGRAKLFLGRLVGLRKLDRIARSCTVAEA
jgi:hypothetical protein